MSNRNRAKKSTWIKVNDHTTECHPVDNKFFIQAEFPKYKPYFEWIQPKKDDGIYVDFLILMNNYLFIF